MSKIINFKITKTHCKSCKMLIESDVNELPGIISIDVNSETGDTNLEYDEAKIEKEKVFDVIKALNYGVDEKNESGKASNTSLLIFGLIAGFMLIGGAFYLVNETTGKSNSSSVKTENKEVIELNDGFIGEKGQRVVAKGGQLEISETDVDDGDMHAFNYYSDSLQKNIYFFVLKASDGTYRAAANACEVCFGAKKGFYQQGEKIICSNCRQSYSKDQIALEKGGCNPGPISKSVAISGGNLQISVSDVEAVAYLF